MVGELKINEFDLVIEVKNFFPEEVVTELRPGGGVESNGAEECFKERNRLKEEELARENIP